MRDATRSRTYRAERRAWAALGDHKADWKMEYALEAQGLVNRLLADPRTAARRDADVARAVAARRSGEAVPGAALAGRRFLVHHDVRVEFARMRRGRGIAYCGLRLIRLSKHASRWLVVHELAHICSPLQEGHGRTFRENYVFLAGLAFGQPAARALRKAFREAGLPVGYRAAPKARNVEALERGRQLLRERHAQRQAARRAAELEACADVTKPATWTDAWLETRTKAELVACARRMSRGYRCRPGYRDKAELVDLLKHVRERALAE